MVIEYDNEILEFGDDDGFLDFICPMIRDSLSAIDDGELVYVSASEIDDMGRDILALLPEYLSENEFLKIFKNYIDGYVEDYNNSDDCTKTITINFELYDNTTIETMERIIDIALNENGISCSYEIVDELPTT